MNIDAEVLARGFTDSIIAELRDAWRKITHCVEQLSDEQLWSRPDESMNSIANLLLHLNGNLRQWIIAGVGGAIDDRDRPREFSERGPIHREELVARLARTLADVERSIHEQTPNQLLRRLRIQGFEVSGFDAIIGSVAHFRGHSQEVVHLTRRLLRTDYRYYFVPQTPEQGAPQ